MSETQWVQHISGHGEKFKLSGGDRACNSDMTHSTWVVDGEIAVFYLPKSEYRLCEPPEVWKDVTGECRVDDYSNRVGEFWSILHVSGGVGANVMSKANPGYRLRKVTADDMIHEYLRHAFVVERRKS